MLGGTMKRIAALTAAAVFGLAACTSAPAQVQAPDRPIISDPGKPGLVKQLLVTQDSTFAGISETTIGEVAVMVCDRLDDGYSATSIGSAAMEAGFTMQQAAAIVAASIVVYCPWHEDNVR